MDIRAIEAGIQQHLPPGCGVLLTDDEQGHLLIGVSYYRSAYSQVPLATAPEDVEIKVRRMLEAMGRDLKSGII